MSYGPASQCSHEYMAGVYSELFIICQPPYLFQAEASETVAGLRALETMEVLDSIHKLPKTVLKYLKRAAVYRSGIFHCLEAENPVQMVEEIRKLATSWCKEGDEDLLIGKFHDTNIKKYGSNEVSD